MYIYTFSSTFDLHRITNGCKSVRINLLDIDGVIRRVKIRKVCGLAIRRYLYQKSQYIAI